MTVELDRERIERFIDAVCHDVDGEVLLVGGALVATWLEPRRVTEDIDVIPLSGDRMETQLRLWDVAERCGMPIEAVNGAAEYFVRRIPGWERRLQEHHRGVRGRVLRPDPTLLVLTKVGRLSERDLADCELVLDRVATGELSVDTEELLAAIERLPQTEEPDLVGRRARLKDRVLERRASGV